MASASLTSPAVESRYAWLRLAVSLLLMTIGGSGMYSVTVVLPAIQAEFGVARADASLPYTLTMIGFGIGGIAMRSGSVVRSLRPGITHTQAEDAAPAPRNAHIELALFCLALPLLAGHFLRRGVLVAAGRVPPYLRPAITKGCILDGRPVSREEAGAQLAALPENALVELSAELEG